MKVEQMRALSGPLKCHVCGCQIKPGQMYLPALKRHVACPNEREIAHAKRMGREP